MASEFSPGGWIPRMTSSQVKQYIKNLKKAQALAQAKLDLAKASGEFETEERDLKEIENILNNL